MWSKSQRKTRGGQAWSVGLAIEVCLTLLLIFGSLLWKTQGFVRSLA